MNAIFPKSMIPGLLLLMLAACGGGSDSPVVAPTAVPDTTPPTVVSVTPANGVIGVAISTTASANFSESVDCTTVTTSSVTLSTGGTPVAGSMTCAGSSATFTPTAALALDATYSFSIGSTVKDVAGNALSSPFTSAFTTAATPPAFTYTTGGTVSGLAVGRGLTLQNNGAETIALTASGNFSFTNRLATGAAYNVAVLIQPADQICTVTNGAGVVGSTNVADIAVTCVTNTYTINGSLTGLASGASVTLQNNGGDSATFTSNGTITFQTPLASLAAYSITVLTQPVGQTCAVTNGAGIVGAGNVANIGVSCALNNYIVGGTLSNLGSGNSITLQNNSANNLTLTANGSFAFSAPIASRANYNVTVLTSPPGQSCSIASGAGTVSGANVTSIDVTCTQVPLPQAPALSVSYGLKQLLLSWTLTGDAEFYRVFGSPDAAAPFAQIGGDSTGLTATVDVAVHLQNWAQARYRVDACNAGGCTPSIAIAAADGVAQSVGYFKASNTGVSDQVGPVAISGDGNTLAFGAPTEDSNATGVNGDESNNAANDAGAVYVYTRTVSGWAKHAYLKASNTPAAGLNGRFGWSLALSRDGNTLAVGAPGESSCFTGVAAAQNGSGCPRAGAIYVFVRNAGAWLQQAYVKDTPPGGRFLATIGINRELLGYSIAISADGNTLLAGAPGEASTRTGIVMGANPSGVQNDAFGDGAGAAYVFARDQGTWSQEAYMKPSTMVANVSSNRSAPVNFGMALAISGDGDTVAIGAPGESSAATAINGNEVYDCNSLVNLNCTVNRGATYVYRRARPNNTASWSQQAYIKPTNAVTGTAFGGYQLINALQAALSSVPSAHVVALSNDGNTLAVGAPGVASKVAVFAFQTGSGGWSQQAVLPVNYASYTHGNDLAVVVSAALSSDGNLLASGAGHVFARSAGAWSQVSAVTAADPSDGFGWSLGLSDDGRTLAIGAPGDDSNATDINGDQSNNSVTDSGAVYLY